MSLRLKCNSNMGCHSSSAFSFIVLSCLFYYQKQSVKHWALSSKLIRTEKGLGFCCLLAKGRLSSGEAQKFTGHQSIARQEKDSEKWIWRFPKADFVCFPIFAVHCPGTLLRTEESRVWCNSSLGRNEAAKSSGVEGMF